MMFTLYHSELNEVHEEVVVNRTLMYHQPMIQGRLNVARVSPNRDFWSYAYHYLFKAASASKPLALIPKPCTLTARKFRTGMTSNLNRCEDCLSINWVMFSVQGLELRDQGLGFDGLVYRRGFSILTTYFPFYCSSSEAGVSDRMFHSHTVNRPS